MIYSEEERKLNKDITIGLIQRDLLSLAEYNVHMAKHLDGGRNSKLTAYPLLCPCTYSFLWQVKLSN